MQASTKCSMTVMDLVSLTRADPGEKKVYATVNPRNHDPLITP